MRNSDAVSFWAKIGNDRLPAAFAAVVALLILVSGCSTTHRLEPSSISRIEPGRTTRAEVESAFGSPRESEVLSNGMTFVRYSYRHGIPSTEASTPHRRLHPGDLLLRTLTVLYDRNGVVAGKLHDESVTPVRRSWNGWIEVGPSLPANTPTQPVKAGDRIDRVIADLGHPMERWIWLNDTTAYVWYYYKDRADKLGQIESRRLLVFADKGGRVADYSLSDYDPNLWFRRGAW